MIRKIKNFILSRFRKIYLFEGKKNKKKIGFKNFKLKTFKKFQSIKDKKIINFIKLKKKRFVKKKYLLALYHKSEVVSLGWKYEGTKWNILEIEKIIDIKNKILLYDFFTFEKFRNRGYYSILLRLIKNFNTDKKFWIYCLSNNYSSKKGIENSNFNLLKIIRK